MPIEFTVAAPPTVQADPGLRATLLDYYLSNATAPELANWLRDLGHDASGSITQKVARIHEHTKYLVMPAEEFPRQTIHYLDQYSSDHLAGICEALGLDESGTKDDRWRRIMRHVAIRERWVLPPESITEGFFTLDRVLPFIHWHMVLRRGQYEKEFYNGFYDEMVGFFGETLVHSELPVASGTPLRIDFHLGHPQKEGVGVEFKMPTNNSEVQKALGQIDLYLARYSNRLIVVLLPDFLAPTQRQLFIEALTAKGVPVVIK